MASGGTAAVATMAGVVWYQGFPRRAGLSLAPEPDCQIRNVASPALRPVAARVTINATRATTAGTASGPSVRTVYAENEPKFVAAPAGLENTDDVCAAPTASACQAWNHSRTPPVWMSTIGTNHTASAAAPAAAVTQSWRRLRVDAATGMSVRRTNIGKIDGRNPVKRPSVTTAPMPCALWGRAPEANNMSRAPASASKLYVDTVDPANHDTGALATTAPAAMPTHMPPSAAPASHVSAAAADTRAATSTSDGAAPRPVTACSARPASTYRK